MQLIEQMQDDRDALVIPDQPRPHEISLRKLKRLSAGKSPQHSASIQAFIVGTSRCDRLMNFCVSIVTPMDCRGLPSMGCHSLDKCFEFRILLLRKY